MLTEEDKKRVNEEDKNFIKDQLINAYEHCSIEEMIENLSKQTTGYNIKSMVESWYKTGYINHWQILINMSKSVSKAFKDCEENLENFVKSFKIA